MESNAASQSSEASVDLQNRVPITGSHTETNIYKNKIYDYEYTERLRCFAFDDGQCTAEAGPKNSFELLRMITNSYDL